ncbi:MAG TPA: transglycosylase domain-containing protein [Kofleriaceae bacterium]|jgi:hypothetical protein
MRLTKWSKRGLWAGGTIFVLGLLAAIGVTVVYPRVGVWMVRTKIGAKLEAKLGRQVTFGAIEVRVGHATLHDIEIRGPQDGDLPLVHVNQVDVDFDGWPSLVGRVHLGEVAIDGVLVNIRRDAGGIDNVRDVIERFRGDNGAQAGGDGGMRPTAITVTHARLQANDDEYGATALVTDGSAHWAPGELVAEARGVTATTTGAPKAAATRVDITKKAGQPPVVSVEGGEVALWPKLALTGINGTVQASPTAAGQYALALAGGYGGVPGQLWTANGAFDPATASAAIDLSADKFQLGRLAPILEHSALVDYQSTSVDTKLHATLNRGGATFAGSFHLTGLNVGHPLIADKEVHDLDLAGEVAGTFDRAARKIELTRGDFVTRNVPFSITGAIVAPKQQPLELVQPPPTTAPANDLPAVLADTKPKEPPRRGPHGVQQASLRLVIPPVDCQRMLEAIPTEMAPYLSGYKMKGVFDADIHFDVDWNDLDATQLDGHIGIKHCRVVDEPADSPKRLKDEFEHYVEVDKGEWMSFVVGPSNPDFVPLDQISPYLVKSIMSTEDSGFYTHHGFIPSEFRTALVNNLKHEAFVQGASSITMQMVKNVLLYREKTLARKLQELFLTWDVENTLTKDRIIEIYLNVIEYGPGLYGIGPASQQFFGKAPKDLTPVEAAFFSTILPSPKARYKQYCEGTLTKWTTGKIERILAIMLKRDRLTQAEYDDAMKTPLLFVKDGTETEEDCLKRVKLAIKNARSTNPLATDDAPPPPVKSEKKHHHDSK